MSDLILHHYPTSPFGEKIRAVLGYKQLSYKSVLMPRIMPKPELQALTGGYRRAPVLQIGADVYCDTALICDVLEHRAATPTLYPPAVKGATRIVAQWADTTLFWAAMAYNLSPKGAAALFAGAPVEVAKAFGQDRAAMAVGMTRLRPGDATAAYKSYLRRLANMLSDQPFLLGDAPSLADFSAYHPLWFSRVTNPVMADILDATPAVLAWMDAIAALGHGKPEDLSPLDAIAVAAANTPAPLADEPFVDEHGIPLGSRVTVTAEIFGHEATEGELLAATRMHYTLRREDERAGTVHVHFPRVGYVLKKAEAST